jgi:hypothetical protein
MHLQSCLCAAVVLIPLGFALHANGHASGNGLTGNLAKKDLTYLNPRYSKSADTIRKLVGRNAEADGICNVIYTCPTTGTGLSILDFSGSLTLNQNQGGTLSCSAGTGQGLLVSPVLDKTIPTFPADIGVDWTASKTQRVNGNICLLTWTFSVGAGMPDPNHLEFTGISNHRVTEICAPEGDVCSQPAVVGCTTSPGTGCQ